MFCEKNPNSQTSSILIILDDSFPLKSFQIILDCQKKFFLFFYFWFWGNPILEEVGKQDKIITKDLPSFLWANPTKTWESQWKGINRKQSTRWQHLSRLKASAFFSLQFFLVVMKHSNLHLGVVLPSGGWQSLIDSFLLVKYSSLGNGLACW